MHAGLKYLIYISPALVTKVAHGNYDPDKYRFGGLWVGLGNLKVGRNSEAIRHTFQNKLIHDTHKPDPIPRFKVLNRKPRWYIDFGTGTGNTLW